MEETSPDSRPEAVKLWRVFRTTRQMLRDRGYQILEDEVNISFDEFQRLYCDIEGEPDRRAMSFTLKPSDDMLSKYSDPKRTNEAITIGTVRVEFNGDKNVGIKDVRKFVHTFDQGNFYTGILVTAFPVSSSAHKIGSVIAPKILELFQESDLLVNITMHELVPKHVLLSQEEKRALLERYRLKESQLPRIQQSDPVARYLGLRRGQVVKIIRRSTTAGRYASYRWCI